MGSSYDDYELLIQSEDSLRIAPPGHRQPQRSRDNEGLYTKMK
jgi:hypothetical protein